MAIKLKLPKEVFLRLGYNVIKWIRADLQKGIMQNDKQKLAYKSETYVKYKKNNMRKFGRGKNLVGRGERLKAYYGLPIESNFTKYVNLTLTGNLKKNMQAQAIKDGVRISYAPADAGKVLGAYELGRDILTLRKENMKNVNIYLRKNIDKFFDVPIAFVTTTIRINI